MYGIGILKGLSVTFRHFIETYVDDLRWVFAGGRYHNARALEWRNSPKERGIFTVQYPEEKIPVPERFRFIPFLLYEDATGEDRCTSCGICAKVCPPQCIWIERGTDPATGRPVPAPREFYIDIDICMNCGFCAEFCPFDAIKMDHDYELADYDRTTRHIFNKARLSKPVSYYAAIRPTDYAAEEEARAAEEAKKAAKKGGAAGSNVAAARERAAAAAAQTAAKGSSQAASPRPGEPTATSPSTVPEVKKGPSTATPEGRQGGVPGKPLETMTEDRQKGEGAITAGDGTPRPAAPQDNEAHSEQKTEASGDVPPEAPPPAYKP